jgi:hypothetical protein
MNPAASRDEVEALILNAKRLPRENVGAGRLDLHRALSAARLQWPGLALPPPVASCATAGVDWAPAQ